MELVVCLPGQFVAVKDHLAKVLFANARVPNLLDNGTLLVVANGNLVEWHVRWKSSTKDL